MSAQNVRPRSIVGALFGIVAFSAIAGVLVSVAITPALAVTTAAASSTADVFENLPEYVEITAQPQQNKIYAVSGYNDDGSPKYKKIATVYFQDRVAIGADKVTPLLQNAVLAAEDRRFYQHGAVDPQGIIRATISNITGGDLQGASTLTQQLVKNICVTDKVTAYPEASQEAERNKAITEECQDPSVERKLKEMKAAIGLEKQLSKDEILLAYLNIAGFGGNVYGIESAAQRYYSTHTQDLTVAQAASLVGIVQAPGIRSLDNPEHYAANQERRDVIIKNMFAYGMIDAAQRDEALATPVDGNSVKLKDADNGCQVANQYARQFCDYVVRSIKDLAPLGATEEERLANWKIGGYKVYTTLDLNLNETAQKTLRKYAPIKETAFQLGASAVSVQPGTGKIITMAQNKVFDNRDSADGGGRPGTSAINFNTDFAYGGSSGFQPGSSYKVFTLLNWLQHGHGLEERVNVTPFQAQQSDFNADGCGGPFGGVWKFKNDAGERGYFTIRRATNESVNGGYVQMALQLNQCDTRDIAESLGMHKAVATADDPKTAADESRLSTNPAAILGTDEVAPMSIAAAYAAIAANGTYCKPIAVTQIENTQGQQLGGQQQDCSAKIDPEVTAAAMDALQGNANRYAANPNDGTPLFGKTGTTDNSKQTWVTLASTALATSVWVGNINGNYPMRSYDGGSSRHTILNVIQREADKTYKGAAFPQASERLIRGVSVNVGNYVGMSEDQAKASIEQIGMTYSNQGEIASAEPEGTIAKQNPEAGTSLSKGQRVEVWISDGSKSTVPDVAAGAPDANGARATLNAAGYSNVAEACVATPVQSGQPTDGNLPRDGQAISSDPGAGTVLKKDKTVTINIAHATC
jgi:membrane peptidoglycan carboxypeptidase